jgi:hypothetical protein
VLGALLALFLNDYFTALKALPCSTPGSGATCYPWGAEGPVADSWNYVSKETYLRASLGINFIFAGALLAPFFARGLWSGIIAMVGILVGGLLALPLLAGAS